MSLPDFEDAAWNARRKELEKAVADAMAALVEHTGGGCPQDLGFQRHDGTWFRAKLSWTSERAPLNG